MAILGCFAATWAAMMRIYYKLGRIEQRVCNSVEWVDIRKKEKEVEP